MFRAFSTAWRHAADFLVSGIVASACMKQRTTKLSIQADRSTGFNQQAGLLMAVRNTLRSYEQAGFWLLLISLLMLPIVVHAVPAGTVINNTATATYNGATTSNSNTVTTTTVIVSTPSMIEFLQYAPASGAAQNVPVAITQYSTSGTTAGPFTPMAPPTPAGSATPINLAAPVPLVPATTYHQGEPIFIRLTDIDQNVDATTAETVMVTLTVAATGDTEVLLLTETGPNTGVFTGYIQSYIGATTPTAANPANGQLGLQTEAIIAGNYVDVVDGTDTSADSVLVDPFGIVFDSSNGLPVNGAQVTIINNATGLPATVYDDDGITPFPSTVTTGDAALSFAPGQYRFPFVAPGTYRLDVVPPATHNAPSVVPEAILQTLPGAPFAIDTQASYALPFVINPGPALEIDIPVDPTANSFFLTKDVNKTVAAVGDLLQYRLTLNNNSGAVATAPQVIDTLPVGLRYRIDSTTVNGSSVADPVISADGRTLTFTLNDMADGDIVDIRYVVDIAVGTHAGDAINTAIANANGGALVSNQASARVRIKEDFLRNKNILMGRVIADNCEAPADKPAEGLEGVRIYLEDGTYVVTDEQGMFHIEGVKPGSHVVQMDLDSLAPHYEPIICDEHTRFAGRAISRFVDLQGGALWRTDFHVKKLPPPKTDVTLSLTSGVDKHIATYHLGMKGGNMKLDNIRLMVSLPKGANYLPGTSVLDNQAIDDPEVKGQVLIYKLGEVNAAWEKQLNFLAKVTVDGEPGKMPSKAFMLFNTPSKRNQRTPVVDTVMKRLRHEQGLRGKLSPKFESFSARLTPDDKAAIRQVADRVRDHKVIRIEVTGHTDNVPVNPRSKSKFADNLALSIARAQSVGEYLVKELELPEDALTVHGKGATEPLASNLTAAGRAENRRVELLIITETMLDASRLKDITTLNNIEVEVEGAWKNQPPADRKTSPEEVRLTTKPDYNKAWVEAARPDYEILWPPKDYNPSIASIKIAVKHDPAHRVTLKLNDEPVSGLNFDGAVKNAANTVMVSQWAGVDIQKGKNTLLVEIRDANGKLVDMLQRIVKMSSLPVRAELVKEKSRLIADGKQTPVIAIRMYDKDDRPIREGLVGQFSVEPPHTAQQEIDLLQDNPLTGLDNGGTRYRVGKDGIALIELKPTTRTGEAVIVLPLENREVEIRPWLQPAQRDWILVGLAEGTVANNTVSGNMEQLKAADIEEGTMSDGRVAFFAKGSIKGEWLLTLAYDSDKDTDEARQRLFQQIDPDSYFTVYGDKTTQDYDAQSSEKLYIRLERKQFYALFGDYDTGITVTELSRYSRSLTGLKSELKTDRYEFNLFASETDQNFIKDEIRGDGTSGLYRLRYPELIINSEKVVIETRDRFRSEVILSSKPMSRHIDYSIDYDAGTIFFKSPVPSRDSNFNPVYIVVDYETTADGSEEWTYGGRGAVRFMDNKLELGISHINEGKSSGDNTLSGVDTTIQLSEHTELKAEYATSKQANAESKDAYLAELSHISSKHESRVYYRETESGFGLGQQRGSEDGTRKIGLENRYHISDAFKFDAKVYQQSNLLTEAEREVIETSLAYDNNHYGINGGIRNATDTYTDGSKNQSTQFTLGAHQSFLDNRLKLRFAHDQSINHNENADYPDRTIIGADYMLNLSTMLFVEQEYTSGDKEETETTRAGMTARPWTGASVSTSVEQQTSEYGPRLFANAGLVQTWQVNDNWSIDASIDKSKTIRDPGNTPLNVNVPPASGSSEDFTAVSLGANYKVESWSWTSRVEVRDADSEDKLGIYSGIVGEPAKGLGMSARLQSFRTEAITGEEGVQSDLRLGLVYRPLARNWTVLNRTDFVLDEQTGGAQEFDNQKLVNNLLLNYRAAGIQFSPYYGIKYVRDTIDNVSYSGTTDTFGLELRYDINKHLDIGAHGSMLRSHEHNQHEYSYGLSLGFNLATNMWLSVGYNWDGFEDDDFSMSGYKAEGAYLKLRFKFDQQSVREAADWFNKN
ncbi:MAG: OmpA family protein [Gammaproteobacteria bacterium]